MSCKAFFLCLFVIISAIGSAQSQIVDDSSPACKPDGPLNNWKKSSNPRCTGGSMQYTLRSDTLTNVTNWATWTPAIKTSGKYRVSVFIPSPNATSTRVTYKISLSSSEITSVQINQNRHHNTWVDLGIHNIKAGSGTVYVDDKTGESNRYVRIGIDAVKWELISENDPGAEPKQDPTPSLDRPNGKPPTIRISDIRMSGPKTMSIGVSIISSSPSTVQIAGRVKIDEERYLDPQNRLSIQSKNKNGDTLLYSIIEANFETLKFKRFEDTTTVSCTMYVKDSNSQGNWISSEMQKFIIRIPVILIRGYIPFRQLGGQFNSIEGDNMIEGCAKGLNERNPMRNQRDFTTGLVLQRNYFEYPTIHFLDYEPTTQSIESGSKLLAELVNYARLRSYSNKVDLIGHSKGGLVARHYSQQSNRESTRKVRNLITANSPHTGSLKSFSFRQIQRVVDFLPLGDSTSSEMAPTYPWFRMNQTSVFFVPEDRESKTLLFMNRTPLQPDIKLYLLASNVGPGTTDGHVTKGTFKHSYAKFEGDSVVPLWSQFGYDRDFNNKGRDIEIASFANHPFLKREDLSFGRDNEHGNRLSNRRYLDYISNTIK